MNYEYKMQDGYWIVILFTNPLENHSFSKLSKGYPLPLEKWRQTLIDPKIIPKRRRNWNVNINHSPVIMSKVSWKSAEVGSEL